MMLGCEGPGIDERHCRGAEYAGEPALFDKNIDRLPTLNGRVSEATRDAIEMPVKWARRGPMLAGGSNVGWLEMTS